MTNPFAVAAAPAVPAAPTAQTGQWLASGATASTVTPSSSWGDLGTVGEFAQPEDVRGYTGNGFYPEFSDLRGRLVLLRPIKVERVKQHASIPVKEGSDGMTDRATVDMVVLDGPPLPVKNKDGDEGPALEIPAELPGKQLFNGKLPEKIKAALRDGIPVLLGRIVRAPQWPDVKEGKYVDGDWRAIERAFDSYREQIIAGKDPEKPKFVWTLANHTAEEKALTVSWLNEQARKTSEARAASIG